MEKIDTSLSLSVSARALISGEADAIANMANISALLFMTLKNINWAGFYVLKDGILVLGPFQGKPACVRINLGKGVCGSAAAQKRTVIVGDVACFPGHIACDVSSRSEIVIPIFKKDGSLYGVLDIDAPIINRFDPVEQKEFEAVCSILTELTDL